MSSIKTNEFEDYKINIKLKISALWVAVMFCYVYGDYIQVYVPGIMAKAMAVEVSMQTQLQFLSVAILMVIPSVMVFLTLVLAPKINRWVNIVISTLFIVMLVSTNITETWWFYLFLTVMEILISVVIIVYSCKWPKTDVESTNLTKHTLAR